VEGTGRQWDHRGLAHQDGAVQSRPPDAPRGAGVGGETYPDYAAQYKRYFDALVTGGFTPAQALEIVKAHGWMPR
jgi:hypothetical protein